MLFNDARSRPVPAHGGKTPYEVKWGRRHTVTLLPFGCEVFVQVEAGQRDKFDARGRRGIFVGYAGSGGIQ